MKHNFNNLQIWKMSRKLVKEVYLLTRKYPKDERFGLTSQTQRSAVSIPSNIAEGCGRGTDKQLSHFLNIAIGSNCELETQIYLAGDLEYISSVDEKRITDIIQQIRKMTIGFQNKL